MRTDKAASNQLYKTKCLMTKTFHSTVKDQDFFSKYQNVVSALRKIRTPTQIISGLTAVGVLYFWSLSAMADYLPEQVAPIAASIVAFLIALMIEIVLRVSVGKSFQQILYKRFTGLHLLMSIIIFLLALAALTASGLTSFKGSKRVVREFKKPPVLQTTNLQDSTNNVNTSDIWRLFRNDSTNIASRFNDRLTASATAHNAGIEAEESKLKLVKKLPSESWSDYNRKKNAIKTQVKALIATRDSDLSEIKAERDNLLFEREKERENALKEVKGEYKAAIAGITAKNEETTTEHNTKIEKEGSSLGWVTVGCLFFFLLGAFAEEVHKKGSKIEETVKQSWWDNLPTIWAEFWHAVNERIQSWIRGQIKSIEDKSSGPILPTIPAEIMNFDNLNQTILNITNQENEIEIEAPKRRQIGFFSSQNNAAFIAHENDHKNNGPQQKQNGNNSFIGGAEYNQILQRIKRYKKRVGEHKQKALAQEKKSGAANQRTLNAIQNNEQQLAKWEKKLNDLLAQNGKI